MRDAFFDAFPIRDNGFSDLARQPTGPGRALYHGDTLHVLVPRDDVNDKRTAGLLLDQHRTDTGNDPKQVQVHRYEIRDHTIVITDENPQSANDFRQQNGYVEKRINGTTELNEFLSAAKHLSTLEIRDGEVHAGGWNWPGPDVTAQDITVLQRAYSRHEQPGFSLDPPKNTPTSPSRPSTGSSTARPTSRSSKRASSERPPAKSSKPPACPRTARTCGRCSTTSRTARSTTRRATTAALPAPRSA
jgi:hypothetical protein